MYLSYNTIIQYISDLYKITYSSIDEYNNDFNDEFNIEFNNEFNDKLNDEFNPPTLTWKIPDFFLKNPSLLFCHDDSMNSLCQMTKIFNHGAVTFKMIFSMT